MSWGTNEGSVVCGVETMMAHRAKAEAGQVYTVLCVLCDMYILPLQKEGVAWYGIVHICVLLLRIGGEHV